MERWHGAGCNAALKAVAHDKVGASTQAIDIGLQAGKIIAAVGIAHDDVTATGGIDAGDQGRAVPPKRRINDAGT